jgi:transcriptional regulator with XRE-family HTH domain
MDAGGFTMSVDAETRLAERLREARETRGLTQDDVARAMGLANRTSISHIESGFRQVKVLELVRFAGVLGVPVTYFTDGLESSLSKRKTRGGGAQ